MSDAPLSRRARRTFEEEAAERAAMSDPTVPFAPGLSSGEIPDASTLSRRDRRRLERLARPLEAWTAEEEMLVTGQIPAMTPERIAEQERISREKAIRAAQDAASASQELRVLAEAESRQAAWLADVPREPQVVEPEPVQPVEPELSQPAPQPVEPELSQPEPQFVEPQVAEPQPVEPQHVADAQAAPTPLPMAEYQPRMVIDDEPLAPVSHGSLQQGADAEPSPAVPDATDAVADIGYDATEQSRVLDELFPPGSNQAALRQQDPFASATSTAAATTPEPQAPASSDAIPTLLPPQPGPTAPTNAVEEIRRLAAEAMSGLERASRSEEAPAAPAADAAAQWEQYPQASSQQTPSHQAPSHQASSQLTPSQPVPAQQAPVRGPSWDEVVSTGSAAPASQEAYETLGVRRAPESVPTTTPGGGLAPHHAVFDQVASGTSGATYGGGIDERRQVPASGQFPSVQSGQFPSVQSDTPGVAPQPLTRPQGPAWDVHPLEQVAPVQPAQADPNDFKPVADAPRPDFSGLYQASPTAQFGAVSGTIPTGQFGPVSGTIPTGSTTTNPSGTIRRLDMPDVGGAKHFKWLHLAVIGALMFVLGVVIYNAAFAQ